MLLSAEVALKPGIRPSIDAALAVDAALGAASAVSDLDDGGSREFAAKLLRRQAGQPDEKCGNYPEEERK